jgi:hypothetical protein
MFLLLSLTTTTTITTTTPPHSFAPGMTDPITTQHLLLECVDMRGLDRAGEDPVAAVVEILSR